MKLVKKEFNKLFTGFKDKGLADPFMLSRDSTLELQIYLKTRYDAKSLN
jgi:hypothetical protein